MDIYNLNKIKLYDPGKLSYGVRITKKKLFNDWKALNDNEKVVYIALKLFVSKEGICYPSMRYLGRVLGHDKNTMSKYIHSLAKKRYLKITKRPGRKGKSYLYNLLK